MRIVRQVLIACAWAALAAPAWAQDDPVAVGAAAAEQWCTRCHDISPEGVMKQHPPSFAAIARFRSPEQIEARIWFPRIHSAMPEFSYVLDRDTVKGLVAYIVSLE